MTVSEEEKIYDKLALVYSFIMKKVDYKVWSEYIASLVSRYVGSNARTLELAAGNCTFASYFMSYYPHLIATDISKSMLSAETKPRVVKVCCNMTNLPFKNKFDLVYSTFDSINYLTTRNKMLNTFKEVSSLLSDKGVFTFDASLEKNSVKHAKVPIRTGSYKGIKFKQQSQYDATSRIHKNIFMIKLDGKIHTEIHRQKIYPFEVYFELLELAGLYVVQCYDSFSYDEGSADSERIQIIARKRK